MSFKITTGFNQAFNLLGTAYRSPEDDIAADHTAVGVKLDTSQQNPAPSIDKTEADKDARTLHGAMFKKEGDLFPKLINDNGTIISLLRSRNAADVNLIRESFKNQYGKDLDQTLYSEIDDWVINGEGLNSGASEIALDVVMMDKPKADAKPLTPAVASKAAETLYEASLGSRILFLKRTDENKIKQTLRSISHEDLDKIRTEFEHKYHQQLDPVLYDEIGSDRTHLDVLLRK